MEEQEKNKKKSILWVLAIIGLSFINYLWPIIVIFALYESIKKFITKSQFIEKVPRNPIAKINENKILS